jgi:hypothetical protein
MRCQPANARAVPNVRNPRSHASWFEPGMNVVNLGQVVIDQAFNCIEETHPSSSEPASVRLDHSTVGAAQTRTGRRPRRPQGRRCRSARWVAESHRMFRPVVLKGTRTATSECNFGKISMYIGCFPSPKTLLVKNGSTP